MFAVVPRSDFGDARTERCFGARLIWAVYKNRQPRPRSRRSDRSNCSGAERAPAAIVDAVASAA